MSVYSIKISVKDDPDIFRIIDVDANHPLIVLHKAILNSVHFEDGELASFYQNYNSRSDREEFCLTEMQKEKGATLMKDVSIADVLKETGDKLTYIYDFLNMWNFEVELESIRKEKLENEKLPKLIKSSGDDPKQELFAGFDEKSMSDDDMELLKNLIEKNDDVYDGGNESDKFDLKDLDDLDDYKDELSGFESLDSLEEDFPDNDNYY